VVAPALPGGGYWTGWGGPKRGNEVYGEYIYRERYMEGRYIYYIERYMKEMGVRGGVGYRGDGGAYGGIYTHGFKKF
jgi:hypothetical protein